MNRRTERRHTTPCTMPPEPVPEVLPPASNDPVVVRDWARRVLDAFGLADWSFGFDNARRRLGACHYNQLLITMSRHYVARNDSVALRQTMLHEVAHALVGPGHGHGPAWMAMARRVGCRPVRCGVADMPPGRFVSTCGGCSRLFRRHRRAGRKMWCRRCGPERGLLTWAAAQEGV